jgi:phosphoribosylamine--glycine ligase
MGTISPSGTLDDGLWQRVHDEILKPFVAGLRADQINFRGMLFPGLMVTKDGPKVLEFNCRFGDPETQVLMRRLDSDLLDLIEAALEDRVTGQCPQWSAKSACCVVMASGGYPGSYKTGHAISGLASADSSPDVVVFHAGTKVAGDNITTSGGRVLGVTSLAGTLSQARVGAYEAVSKISFVGCQFRRDIGGVG